MAQRGGYDAQWPPQAPGAGQVTDSQRRPMSAGARHHQSFSPAQDHMELLDMVAEVRPSPQRPSGPRPSGRGQRPNSAGVLVPQSAATPPGGLKASPLTGQSAKTPGARPRPASARPASSRGRVVVSDTTRLNSARPASAGWREAPRRNDLASEFDVCQSRAEPIYEGGPRAADEYTQRQINAAKYIVAATRRRERRQRAGDGGLVKQSPSAPNPKGPDWTHELQQELVATAESMRVAQYQLTQEREMRMNAVRNEERLQMEARNARRAAFESSKEQQESERKMLQTMNGTRMQREQLQQELTRLAEQQHELQDQLEQQRQRAEQLQREKQEAVEFARSALAQKEREFEMQAARAEAERLEHARRAKALASEHEAQKKQMEAKFNEEKEKRIEHTKAMAVMRIVKRNLGGMGGVEGLLPREGEDAARAQGGGNEDAKAKVCRMLLNVEAHVGEGCAGARSDVD